MGEWVVEGTKKDAEELKFEELWMKRIEILESQYDHHVSLLEKRLLDGKINKRLVTALEEQNSRLKNELKELKTHSGNLELKLSGLQTNFYKIETKKHQLTADLEAKKKEISGQRLRLKENAHLVKAAIREEELSKKRVLIGENKVEKLDAVVDQLEQDLTISRSEFQTVGKQSHSMALSLMKAEEEKRKIAKEKAAAADAIAFLRRERETDEEQMLRLNQELKEIVQQLKIEKKNSHEKERQLQITEKNSEALRDELKNLLAKVTSSALETRYWKEEAETLMKSLTNATSVPVLPPSYSKSKQEERQDQRSKKAQLEFRPNTLERRLATMESEKTSLTNQMKSMTTLHKSLFRLYEKNLNERKAIEERAELIRPKKHGHHVNNLQSNAQIEKQGKKLETLENELLKSKRAYNFLRFKLSQKSELERNLGLAERTLFQVEREKRECEAVATKAARKLGIASAATLLPDLLSEIKYIQDMRNRLPLIRSRVEDRMEPRLLPSDLETNMLNVQRELRGLERKQAVYQNILEAKQRLKEQTLDMDAEMEAEEGNSGEASESSENSETSDITQNRSTRAESLADEENLIPVDKVEC